MRTFWSELERPRQCGTLLVVRVILALLSQLYVIHIFEHARLHFAQVVSKCSQRQFGVLNQTRKPSLAAKLLLPAR